MLKTRNQTQKIIAIVSLVLLVIGLILSVVVAVKNEDTATRVTCLFSFAALMYAGFYILMGYSKNAAKYYRVFAFLIAVNLWLDLASVNHQYSSYWMLLLTALGFALIICLAVGKDLGRERSSYLCYGLIAVSIITLIVAIVSGMGFAVVFSSIIKLILAIVMTVITYAKYYDKKLRGTK